MKRPKSSKPAEKEMAFIDRLRKEIEFSEKLVAMTDGADRTAVAIYTAYLNGLLRAKRLFEGAPANV